MSHVPLINDNESITNSTFGMLEDMGWEVYVASSRKAAIYACVARRPSLAVVDIEMRGGTGLEMIATIRRTDKKLFILAVTRGSQDDTLLRVAEVCGANHHVIGPVSEAKLFAAIEAGRTSGFFQAGTQQFYTAQPPAGSGSPRGPLDQPITRRQVLPSFGDAPVSWRLRFYSAATRKEKWSKALI